MTEDSTDLSTYHWYHGKMTRERAEWILGQAAHNKFLVRDSAKDLVLSTKIRGWISHQIITCSSSGRYLLRGRRENFCTIPDMITYYREFPLWKKQVLGSACDRNVAGK